MCRAHEAASPLTHLTKLGNHYDVFCAKTGLEDSIRLPDEVYRAMETKMVLPPFPTNKHSNSATSCTLARWL